MKSEILYLHHIRERCERIAGCVRMGRDTAEMREQLPGVDWRRIGGLRDVIIHDCPSVELETVWTIASRDVPTLCSKR